MHQTRLIKRLGILFSAMALLALAACSSTSTPSASPGTVAVTTPVATTPATSSVSPSVVPTITTSPVPTNTSTSTSTRSITLDIVAQNMAFNVKTLSVPAGAAVTLNFNNKDGGIPHNVAVYQNLPGGQTKSIFVGQVISGPSTTTYQFIAPSDPQGSYFFECDIHPQIMTGTFTVTP